MLMANDSSEHFVLVLPDLTAAFDNVNHNILMSHLQLQLTICGTELNWFRTYLVDRTLSANSWLCILHCSSSFGVPQGSILGPMIFSLSASHMVQYSGSIGSFFIVMLTTVKYATNKKMPP